MEASKTKQLRLSASALRELVCYDETTGKMTWRIHRMRPIIGREIGTLTPNGYRAVTLRGVGRFMVHRLVWLFVYGEWPERQLDHINGDRSDNRIANLRPANNRQNCANRDSIVGRKLKGITFYRGKWIAQIRVQGKNTYLGSFNTPEAAHALYAKRAREIHGEFARV